MFFASSEVKGTNDVIGWWSAWTAGFYSLLLSHVLIWAWVCI